MQKRGGKCNIRNDTAFSHARLELSNLGNKFPIAISINIINKLLTKIDAPVVPDVCVFGSSSRSKACCKIRTDSKVWLEGASRNGLQHSVRLLTKIGAEDKTATEQ